MKKTLTLAASVLAATCATGSIVSAATIDLTDPTSYDISMTNLLASGTLASGVTWEITSAPAGQLTYTGFDGNFDSPLADELDGIGVTDDELSHGTEQLFLTFSQPIFVTGFHFLDLFEHPSTDEEEVALVTVGASNLSYDAVVPFSAPGTGYRFGAAFELGTLFTFTVSDTNDGEGVPDYALAGFDVRGSGGLAPIPVPARMLLLGTGLAALSTWRRRKG